MKNQTDFYNIIYMTRQKYNYIITSQKHTYNEMNENYTA